MDTHTLIASTLVASLGVLLSLWRGSWLRRYRWLAALLLVQGVILQGVSLALSIRHPSYRYIFLAGTLLSLVLTASAVVELVDTIFADFPGLLSTGRTLVRLAAVGAGIFGVAVAWTGMSPAKTAFQFWFTLALASQRGLTIGLTAFLVVILGMLAVLRARLSAPQLGYAAVFCAFFLAKAGALLYFEWAGRGAVAIVRDGLMGIQILCLAAWIIIFSTWRYDSVAPPPPAAPDLNAEDALIQRVSSASAALEKLYRR